MLSSLLPSLPQDAILTAPPRCPRCYLPSLPKMLSPHCSCSLPQDAILTAPLTAPRCYPHCSSSLPKMLSPLTAQDAISSLLLLIAPRCYPHCSPHCSPHCPKMLSSLLLLTAQDAISSLLLLSEPDAAASRCYLLPAPSIDSAIVDQWKPFSPGPTPYGLYHGVDHTQGSVVGPWSATRAGRPASSQHPALTVSRRRLSFHQGAVCEPLQHAHCVTELHILHLLSRLLLPT
jgi:hypothetical protein